MKNEESKGMSYNSVFKQLIQILDLNYKSLEKANSGTNLLQVYSNLLSFLKTRNETEILQIISTNHNKQRIKQKAGEDQFDDHRLSSIGLNEVEKIIDSEEVTKKTIERIAIVRFNMTKGEVSSISNRRKLVENIKSLIANERTHEAIARQAGQKYE